uniref:MYND finger protein n=1 Tax=Pithovirus LCPAC406 TaxID=2506599 RepID=A0A481ZG11_9VIRU|nr:MAG: MYND finger protein [Pithovirus LCPAC406]
MEYKGHNVSATIPKVLYSAQLSITNYEGYKEDPTSFLQEHYVALSGFKYGLTGYSVLKISEIIKTYKSKDRIVRSKLIDIAKRMKLVSKNHFILLSMKDGHPHTIIFCPIITDDDVGTVNAMIRFNYSMFPRDHAPMEEEVPFIVDQLLENDLTTVPSGNYRKCERSGLDYPPCFTCFRTDKKVRRCGICRTVAYCSKECQKEDWKKHKKICKQK